MPEILSMIQVNKMTPAPAVLVVVSTIFVFLHFSSIRIVHNYLSKDIIFDDFVYIIKNLWTDRKQ